MKMPGRLRLRGQKKRTKERNLVSDDSGHSERIPMFNLGRVNRRAHHFQSKEYVILQKAGQVMAKSLPPEAIEKASERPTMAIRTWLRSQCENYGTWREEEELAQILNGANPASLIGQKDPDPETSESSDDDTISIMDAMKRASQNNLPKTPVEKTVETYPPIIVPKKRWVVLSPQKRVAPNSSGLVHQCSKEEFPKDKVVDWEFSMNAYGFPIP